MSTGAGCRFIQTEPDEWHYELQRYPYGDTPDYNKYGPFPTFKAADDHLSSNHANPGGYMIFRLEDFECDHEWIQEGNYKTCPKCGRDQEPN